jgi:hypothetical protein
MKTNMKARGQTGIGLTAMLAGVIACAPAWAASPKAFPGQEVVLRSSHFSVRFETRDHVRLTELRCAATKRNYLCTADTARLFVVTTSAGQWDATSFELARVERGRGEVTFHLACPQPALEATLRAEATGTDEVRLRLQLRNAGPEPLNAKVAFPVLGGLQTGEDLVSTEYLFPLNGGCVGTTPAHLKTGYGNCFIQVMDIADAQGGLTLRVEDNQAQAKVFEFVKRLSKEQAPPRAF